KATAGRCVSRTVLIAMAIPPASPAFQRAATTGAQFCAFDSWLRHRSPRHAPNPTCGSDVGARSAYRFVKLGFPSGLGCRHRDVSADGLCLLVVALGQSHGAAVLAVS